LYLDFWKQVFQSFQYISIVILFQDLIPRNLQEWGTKGKEQRKAEKKGKEKKKKKGKKEKRKEKKKIKEKRVDQIRYQ
jgi:hypothetical protein